MLHLRVICPRAVTDDVAGLLTEHAGAAHLVVLHGVAVSPQGDVVEADIAREAAEALITSLRELGVDRSGGITLEEIDTALSDAASRAEQDAPGDPADAVVWEELLARTGEESRLNAMFLAFLSIACLLAAVGVIADSPVTIVGAMILGPEYGPLAAFAVALVRRRWDLGRQAVVALAVGFPVAMAITALGTVVGSAVGMFDRNALLNGHDVDFVYRLGPWSLIVALLAGAAGMLSMTSAKSAVLVGVFVSVTTVPAAGYASVAATLGEWVRFGEAVGQLAVNLVGIVVSAVLVLILRKETWTTHDDGRPLPTG